MNILTVIPWFPSFSTGYNFEGIFQYHQSKKLVEKGNKVVILAIQKPGMPKYEIIDGISVYRFPAYTIPKIRYFVPRLFTLNRMIINLCQEHKIDVIDFFSSDFLTTLPAIYIKKKSHVPTVVVVNGLPGISWFTGSRIIDNFGFVYTHLIGKFLIKSADGVRLLHSGLLHDLSKLGIKFNHVESINQGVNTDTFYPQPDSLSVRASLGIGNDEFLVLFVGRLVYPLEMKGTPFLIDAIKPLVKDNKKIKLVFVGDGDGRKANEKLTESIKNNVIYTGRRQDVNRFMSAADVLVLPSLSEGCPVVVLEASACGTPVIASRVGGVPDLIEDYKTGIITKPRSSSEITQALVKMMDNPELRLKMGKMAKERIELEFTWDRICNKLESFYSEVIKG